MEYQVGDRVKMIAPKGSYDPQYGCEGVITGPYLGLFGLDDRVRWDVEWEASTGGQAWAYESQLTLVENMKKQRLFFTFEEGDEDFGTQDTYEMYTEQELIEYEPCKEIYEILEYKKVKIEKSLKITEAK